MFFANPIPFKKDLNTKLLRFGAKDYFTIRDACEAVQIFGGVGSGKSSTSGRALAHSYLKAGMGGLVCCAKNDEADLWRRYARETGREDSMIFLDTSRNIRFNFLDYASVTIAANGFDYNLIDIITDATNAVRSYDTKSSGGENIFFKENATKLLSHALPILRHTYGNLRMKDLYDFINTTPRSFDEAKSEDWQRDSFMCHTMLRLADKAENGDSQAEKVIEEHGDFWVVEVPNTEPRVASNIKTTLTGMIDPFLHGIMRELFCTYTNIVPELSRQGMIIVMDLPAREYGKMAIAAQQLFKMLWQFSMERDKKKSSTRPVFMWADEAQFFMNEKDIDHLSVSRSARVCNVFITQDMPTYYSRIQATKDHSADSLMAKFQTRIFHANSDARTNRYASDLCGKVDLINTTQTQVDGVNISRGGTSNEGEGSFTGGRGRNTSTTKGYTTYKGDDIPPEYFSNELRRGGTKENKFKADAIVYSTKGKFKATNRSRIKVEFSQK